MTDTNDLLTRANEFVWPRDIERDAEAVSILLTDLVAELGALRSENVRLTAEVGRLQAIIDRWTAAEPLLQLIVDDPTPTEGP